MQFVGWPVIAGAVLSILIVSGTERVRPAPFVAEHVSVMPAISFARVVDEHPLEEAMPDSGSVTDQATVTLLRYQPFVPKVPLTVGVIAGGVRSAVAIRVVASATPF